RHVELKRREELETISMNARTPLQPAIVTPKQALSIKPFGLDMDVLLTTEATGGATSVIVAWHKPGEGPPDHVHFNQEEILFIIEGLYEVTVGNETANAGPGGIVFIPRNVVHRFKNVGGITGRMLAWSLPGGQDHYLKAISELAAGGGFTSEKVIEVSKMFDTHFPSSPECRAPCRVDSAVAATLAPQLSMLMSAFGAKRTSRDSFYLSAFGAKRTCRERRACVDLTKVTRRRRNHSIDTLDSQP